MVSVSRKMDRLMCDIGANGGPLVLLGVVDQLKLIDGRKHPRKKAKLLNWIKSHCTSMSGFISSDEVYKELIASQMIREEGSSLRYNLKK